MSERIEPRSRRVALYGAVGAVGGFAVGVLCLFVLFAGLGVVWVLDPQEDTRPDGNRHMSATGTGLPTGPSGTPARILVFAIGSVFVLVGLALGRLLVVQMLGEAPEARLVAGLGIGSAVMLLFGGLFLSLGIGTELQL